MKGFIIIKCIVVIHHFKPTYSFHKIDEHTTFDNNDFRNTVPRFSEANRKANQTLVDSITKMSTRKNVTAAQIALAWLLAQKPWIVPIPGTTKLHRLYENTEAEKIFLDAGELKEITDAVSEVEVQGVRYAEHSQKMIDR